ncbi:hypothetical protein VFPFJ_11234 [Purpureocillium lilacinum]|uniref:Uncharacterized protein n=1 Tax=Purpureocillium lilacinum TaxID=33203 RepID=A0A179GK35_PURLI|nr:hypothetical protein VFPFJ_11234 [Purpureocillium lilacinum]OAQ65699.1 hypothetical protein VFPFJ_11234 [Purpureocillium lilacinum]OAQ78237.1 hypothetical protein VFPBJ_06356 [Purpureocillium lilacinum]
MPMPSTIRIIKATTIQNAATGRPRIRFRLVSPFCASFVVVGGTTTSGAASPVFSHGASCLY